MLVAAKLIGSTVNCLRPCRAFWNVDLQRFVLGAVGKEEKPDDDRGGIAAVQSDTFNETGPVGFHAHEAGPG